MEKSLENFQVSLEKAKKAINAANYILSAVYPIVKENRLMIKILEEVYISMMSLVKAILQYEYFYKRIRLYSDAEDNFATFAECAAGYGILREEVSDIRKVFLLIEKHKHSPMEFVRKEKFVIMSDNLKTESIFPESLKHYIQTADSVLNKIGPVLRRNDRYK